MKTGNSVIIDLKSKLSGTWHIKCFKSCVPFSKSFSIRGLGKCWPWFKQYIIYMYLCLLHFNPLRAKFFRGNIKHIFTFYVIPPHGYDTGGWNPSSNKTSTYPFYIVNIMAAGVLATQGTRTSAAMLLTQLNWDNSDPARYGLRD